MNEPVLVDSRGKSCPQPIVDIARVAKDLVPGARLVLLSDDPATATDLPAWCFLKGHHYLGDAVDYELGYLVELGLVESAS
jgi:tRNA 2-thiouridine synthesizing protein A